MKAAELRDLNVIGAFALALADDFKGSMQDLADGNESACSALIVVGQRAASRSTACPRSCASRNPARCAWSTASPRPSWSSAKPEATAAPSPCG
jgi:hypothetical protein